MKFRIASGHLIFWCVPCGHAHCINVGPGGWSHSVNDGKLSVEPSVLCYSHDASPRCHLYVRDGQVEYLADSTHAFAGKTVPMEDVPEHYRFG